MRKGIGLGAVVLAMGVVAGCRGGAEQRSPAAREQARQDSSHLAQKALQDSGVTVDTQTIDTGGIKGTPSGDD